MGQDSSTLVDDNTPPETLQARNVDAVAKYINNGRKKRIVVMTGAGISTSAGIPDFRSPDTGLYANLARLDLPYAEAVFSISYFRQNPQPFYTLAHELYPGKFRPTISHCFVRLLSDKGLLLKLFTQNIDCLEREAGVPDEKIVEAHGSFARQRCIDCKTPYPDDLMKEAVTSNEVPRCVGPQCNGLVKPDIVFFGEALPEEFFRNRELPAQADLCIVMGTSLTVQPFASLPDFCSQAVPRVLINKERVSTFGTRADDVLLLGDCDDEVRRLASALGWIEELEALWHSTSPAAGAKGQPSGVEKTKDEVLEDEVAKLTRDIDETLKLSNSHKLLVQNQLFKNESLAEQDSKNDQSKALIGTEIPSNGSAEAEGSETDYDDSGSCWETDSSSRVSHHDASEQNQHSEKGLQHVLGDRLEKPLL